MTRIGAFLSLIFCMGFATLCQISIQHAQEKPEGSTSDSGDASNESEASKEAAQPLVFDPLKASADRQPIFKNVLPSSIEKSFRAAEVNTNKLKLYFDRQDDMLAVEYEGETTEAPVIMGFWERESCESELSAETYRERKHRHANLCFEIKSKPRNFGAYEILIDHHVVTPRRRRLVQQIVLENYETYCRYPIQVQKLVPGLNEFTLRIRFTNEAGVTTTSDGLKHYTLVHEIAAFDYVQSFDHHATTRKVQKLSVYQARLGTDVTFTLTPAIDPEDVSVRVLRKGARRVDTSKLDVDIRTKLDDAFVVATEELIYSSKLGAIRQEGFSIQRGENGQYHIRLEHLLSATSSVAPLSDDWEYVIELREANRNQVIEKFPFVAGASIGKDLKGQVFLGLSKEDATKAAFESK